MTQTTGGAKALGFFLLAALSCSSAGCNIGKKNEGPQKVEEPKKEGAPAPAPASPEELEERKRLQGKWEIVKYASETGHDALRGREGKLHYTFGGDQLSYFVGGQRAVKGTYRVDPSKAPKTIDFIADGPPGRNLSFKGIYAPEGTYGLKVCFLPESGSGPRPTEFKEAPGHVLIVLETAIYAWGARKKTAGQLLGKWEADAGGKKGLVQICPFSGNTTDRPRARLGRRVLPDWRPGVESLTPA